MLKNYHLSGAINYLEIVPLSFDPDRDISDCLDEGLMRG